MTGCVFAVLALCLLGPPSGANALTYYVAPGGSNGNAGTQSSPWANIQHAADVMAPGDTVVILPGVFPEAVNLTRSGTAAAYITYQAMPGAVMESPDPAQDLIALNVATGVAYLRLQGFEVRGGYYKAVYIREGAHHIEILDCDLHHNHGGIGWIGSSQGLVERCQIHDNQSGGMGFRYGAHDIVVRDTASYNHDDGLGCSGDADGFAADETAYNLTFERAEAFANSEDGFDFKARNVVIDRSLSHDNNCVGVKLWNTALLQNSLVYGNGRGAVLTSIVSGGGTVVRLINNTVADNTNLALSVGGSSDKPYAVELFNNVVSGDSKLLDFLDCVALTEDFNIFHRPAALADHIVKRIGCVATGDSVRFSGADINSGAWSAHSGQGAQSRALDPLYVNLLAGDFSLQPSSPAIDAGWAAVAPAIDIDGTPRPQANGVDIGAYEATDLMSLSVVTVGSGTVTSSPDGITCGADCLALFPADSVVTLTASPGADSTFTGWSSAGCGATNPCTTVISANVQITATFTTTVTPADLVVTLVGIPPASAAPGDAFSASDTVANQGGSTTLGTTSRYYLSLDAARGGSDILLTGSRAIPILAPSATSSGSVSVTIPSTTPPAIYYLLACADDLNQVPESDETNNCRAAAATVQVTAPPPPPSTGADLVVTEMLNPPAAAPPGSSFGARDWVLNQGTAAAGPSVTRYYLSLDTSRDPADVLLGGSRAVGALTTGQTSKGSVTVTVPSSIPAGLYYLLACADDLSQVTETSDTNNCRASQTRVQVGSPTATVTLTVTIAGLGSGSVSGPGIACGSDCSESVAPGTSVTLTASPGTSATFIGWTGGGCGATNPCTTVISASVGITATFAAAAPGDLIVAAVGNPPASAAPGATFAATDTVANSGPSTVGASTTRYYLSPGTTWTPAAVLLPGSRAVASLGPSATSAGGTTVTIPSTLAIGLYYLLACADDLSQIPESNEANNCGAATATVQVTAPPPPPASAADLVVSEMFNPPASAAPGSSFGARDWVVNQGTATAGSSLTRYYLSLDTARDATDILLGGSRTLSTLVPGQTSKGSITVTVPAAMPSGLYYLLACADDTNQVGEANEANNCRASQTTVQIGSN